MHRETKIKQWVGMTFLNNLGPKNIPEIFLEYQLFLNQLIIQGKINTLHSTREIYIFL